MMFTDKEMKFGNCIMCGNRVIDTQAARATDKLGYSDVLERFKDIIRGDLDETKISTIIMCTSCRDEVDAAYTCAKKLEKTIKQPGGLQKTIIIVNQLEKEINQEELENMFSKYGQIQDFYPRTNPSRYDDFENFARITFSSADATLKVMEAAQKKELCYRDKPLVVTRVSENSSPIDILPDVCLSKIFSYIEDADDAVQLGKVCKRWEEVLAHSWNNIASFSKSAGPQKKETIGILKSMLYAFFGLFLVLIIKGIAHFCKNVQWTIGNRPDSLTKSMIVPRKNIENLELKLTREEEKPVDPQKIFSELQKCTKLRRLFLDGEFDYNLLQHLPENMLEIHLFPKGINTKLSIDLSKFQNLKALLLCNFDIQEDSLNGLETLMGLEYLSFSGSRVHQDHIRKILSLEKLKYLVIPNCGIDDEILSQILQHNLNLECLNISDNRSITDLPFQYIARLTKLKALYMRNLSRVTASDLMEVHTLETLDVEGCTSITDWTLMMMIVKSPELRFLYAAGPATWRLLINARTSMPIREARRYLPGSFEKYVMKYLPSVPVNCSIEKRLSIFADEDLVEKWSDLKQSLSPFHVLYRSNPPRRSSANWAGWYSLNTKFRCRIASWV